MAEIESKIGKQLGQLRPANTTAASLYSPGSNMDVHITLLIVCNTTGSAATFRLFHDEDGTTYDATTALYYDKSVSNGDVVVISYNDNNGIWMGNSSGNLAVRTDTGNALTFTVYGKENIK